LGSSGLGGERMRQAAHVGSSRSAWRAGGVNPWHSAGEAIPFRNRFWKNEYFQNRAEKLWGAISARYQSNSAVVGYDVINEPFPPLEVEISRTRVRPFPMTYCRSLRALMPPYAPMTPIILFSWKGTICITICGTMSAGGRHRQSKGWTIRGL
jgi:hypothetical protein